MTGDGAAFHWDDVLAALGWTGRETVNLGETLVDRFAGETRPALRWIGAAGARSRRPSSNARPSTSPRGCAASACARAIASRS